MVVDMVSIYQSKAEGAPISPENGIVARGTLICAAIVPVLMIALKVGEQPFPLCFLTFQLKTVMFNRNDLDVFLDKHTPPSQEKGILVVTHETKEVLK